MLAIASLTSSGGTDVSNRNRFRAKVAISGEVLIAIKVQRTTVRATGV
jgi:hypothetical protein